MDIKTWSLNNTMKGESVIKAPISLTLRAYVMANKESVFTNKWSRGKVAIGSNGGLIKVTKYQTEVLG